MDPSTIVVTVIVILGLYLLLKREGCCIKKHGVPFKDPFFLLGSTWKAMLFLEPFAKVTQDIYNLSSGARYIGFYNRMTPTVMLRDPELIKTVAIRNFDHFPDHKTFPNAQNDSIFSKNLLLLQGDRWKEIRTLLSPIFTSSKMRTMFKLLSECAVNASKFLTDLPADQSVVEMRDIFARYTNDVIASCAFGINVNSMTDRENKFFKCGKEILNLHTVMILKFIMLRVFPRLSRRLGITLIRTEVTSFFEDVVSSTIKSREEQGITRPDMIQLMMETRGKLGPGKDLTIQDMTGHAFMFFFGGFDTTSSLMSFAAHELAVNALVQEKLRTEIDKVSNESSGEVTYEEINGMKYLDAVICETLRMYPVVPITDRECAKDFELPPTLPGVKPFTMKRGSHLWLPIYAIHHDPKYYADPDKFDPDRFTNREENIVNSDVYLPFGIGQRICIASRFAVLQSKVVLFHILARCELKVSPKTFVPMKLNNGGIFLNAKNGFWLRILPRDKLVRSNRGV